MIGVFQPWHLIVVLVIVVMVFGPGKLPELGRVVGDGLRELKRASGDGAATPPAARAPVSVLPSIACSACNAAVPSGAQFCGNCGTALARSRAA
jgi:sec-independent protein translocase protein TatA